MITTPCQPQTETPDIPIDSAAKGLRDDVRKLEVETRKLMEHQIFKVDASYAGQYGEMKAQIMLAVRHLEDARMRLGKVCQYAGDGTSIYDKA